MKSIFLLISLFLIHSLSCSQVIGVTSQRYFFPDYNAPALDICTTVGNGFAVVGTVEYDQNNSIPYILYCDSLGQQIWSRPYSTFNSNFAFNRVIQLPDSSLIIVGKMLNPLQNDFGAACLKLDKNGNEIWKKSIGDNSGEVFSANDVIFTSDSALLIVGTVVNKSSFFMKLDLDGTKVWSKTFYFEGDLPIDFQELVAVKEKSDGHFVAVGTTNYGGNNYKGFVLEADENGNLIWINRFNEHSVFTDVLITSNGLLIRCFSQFSNLINTDFAGNMIWGKRYFDEDHELNLFPKMNKFSDGSYGLCSAGFSSGSFVKINDSGAILFDAGLFGKCNMMVESQNRHVLILNNGPLFGLKQLGLLDAHFAVAMVDSLDNNLDLMAESCFWDLNLQVQNGTFTTYEDTLLTGGELTVYNAMMELFNSSFEQESACVIFLGSLADNSNSNFDLFPNPATSVLTITSDKFIGESFQLIDQQGRVLKTGILSFSTNEITIDTLKVGIYSIRIDSEIKRFVKN